MQSSSESELRIKTWTDLFKYTNYMNFVIRLIRSTGVNQKCASMGIATDNRITEEGKLEEKPFFHCNRMKLNYLLSKASIGERLAVRVWAIHHFFARGKLTCKKVFLAKISNFICMIHSCLERIMYFSQVSENIIVGDDGVGELIEKMWKTRKGKRIRNHSNAWNTNYQLSQCKSNS